MKKLHSSIGNVRAPARLGRAIADDSERRTYHAVGTGGGLALAGLLGLGVATITSGLPAVVISSLFAAPLIPAGSLLGEWLWRRKIRRTFASHSGVDEYFSLQELVRRDYQQQLKDIEEANLPSKLAESLKIRAFRDRTRHEKLLTDLIRLSAGSSEQ